MLTLEDAHYRLLHHRRYREDFLHGKWDRLDLSDDDLIALGTQDSRDLLTAAAQIRREVLHHTQGHFTSLRSAYPKTLAHWARLMPDDEDYNDLISMFLESRCFEKTRPRLAETPRITHIEAFFEFATRMACFPADLLDEEWLVSALSGLASGASPSWSIHDPRIEPTELGWQAIVDRSGQPYLYAIRGGQLVMGTITPLVRGLLQTTEEHDLTSLGRQYGISSEALHSVLDRLHDMGLRATPQAAAAK